MISHFHKKINLIMYIIEKKFKLNFNYFIWSNFQKKYEFSKFMFL